MRRVARSLKPSRFSDISALVALYRPGPMELINDFIKGKQDPKSIKYPHPDLKPVLASTYGIAVYQEQVLQIANVMAGYSLGEADILRRAIGKKKKSLMDKEMVKFSAGAKTKGYTEAVAKRVWGYIEKFASYGFNLAHATSYAMISYQTAYLKALYPVEFMAAVLSTESNDKDKVALAIEECRRMGIVVLPPSINASHVDFTLEAYPQSLKGTAIRFGLSAIKNVGTAAISAILEAKTDKPFTSLTDFCRRVDNQKVNKKVIASLIQVGALDEFAKRAVLLTNLDNVRSKATARQKEASEGQVSLFGAEEASSSTQDNFQDVDELPHEELLKMEKDLLGLYIHEHPFAEKLKTYADLCTHRLADINAEEHLHQSVTVAGLITTLRVVLTKRNNQEMAFGTLEDQATKISLVIFPKLYQTAKPLIQQNTAFLVRGKVNLREDELSLVVEELLTSETVPAHKLTSDNFDLNIPRSTPKPILEQLSLLLKSHPGPDSLTLVLPSGSHEVKHLKLPYTVCWDKALRQQVELLLSSTAWGKIPLMANSIVYNDQTFRVGDTIIVAQKIVEDEKTRFQNFEGILIAVTGSGNGKAIRVRKLSHMAIGVERIWPIKSPMVGNITLKKRGNVRRAKLDYLRKRVGKEALLTKAIVEPKPVSKRKSKPKAKPETAKKTKK